MKRRSLSLAMVATAVALLPMSIFGLVGTHGTGSMNSFSPQAEDDEELIQFELVSAADVITNCFPDAVGKVKVLRTAEQVGTDSFTLSVKRLRPNTDFAVFLTELPAPPFGATQFIANLHTNANGKGSVTVNAIIEDAFVSQPIDGQRVRKDLNHVVFWFADPADANACFAPANAPITPFDADGNAGPAAMSSRNSQPGAPLP